MGIKTYTVHVKPGDSVESARFVPEGFSWFAFLFGPLWALYHRLWIPALLLFAIAAALKSVENSGLFSQAQIGAIQMGVQAIWAFVAYDILRLRYAREGYELADIVASGNYFGAQQRFFDRVFASHSA